MLYKYLCFLSILVSCLNPSGHKPDSLEHKDSNRDTIQTDQTPLQDTLGARIIDTLPIYVNLKVFPFSMDSIIADVTFFNKGNNSVWLYKPILPNTTLMENTFTIVDKRLSKLPFLGQVTTNKYYPKNDNIFPLTIPDLSKNNLESFGAGDSVHFNVNLAKFYDFKVLKDRSEDSFLIEYICLLPYIEGGRHIFRMNENLNIIQPVYFVITSAKKKSEAFRTKIKLPSS